MAEAGRRTQGRLRRIRGRRLGPSVAVPSALPRPRQARGPALPIPRWVWLVVLIAVVIWLARDVLGPFVVAGVIAYAFGPLVEEVAARSGQRRVVIVAAGYAATLLVVSVVVLVLARPLARDLAEVSSGGPDTIASVLRSVLGRDTIVIGGATISIASIAAQLRQSLAGTASSPADALHLVSLAGRTALDVVLVLIVSFYLLLDAPRAQRFALRLFEPVTRRRVETVTDRIHIVLARWLRGQLLLIALVAAVMYVALGPALHIPYALGIALLTGVLEIVPLVGPIVAASLATIVAFGHGGSGLAIVVLVLYVVVRQVEDQVVMPLVIGRAVHLHPVVTIFAVLVGLSAWGVLGGLLAVPVMAAINVTLAEVYPEASTVPPATSAAGGALPSSSDEGPADEGSGDGAASDGIRAERAIARALRPGRPDHERRGGSVPADPTRAAPGEPRA